MIRPVTSADRAVLRGMLAEFYDTDAVLHPLPASYHDAALDERAERAASASAFDEEERAALARGIGQVRAYVALLGELARHAGQGAPTPNEAKTAPTREERKEAK